MPVFLLLLAGKLLARSSIFSDHFSRDLSRLTYWIAMPALLIDKITGAPFSASGASKITLLMILATLGAGALAYPAAKLLRINRSALGAFVQGSIRGNNAFVGLPVIIYALRHTHPEAEAIAILALAPAVIIYNFLSVTILLAHAPRENHAPGPIVKLYVKQLSANPLLISCILALFLKSIGLHLPLAAARTLSTLGSMAPGMALISIGAALSFRGAQKGLPRSLTAASIQVFAQPLIGFALARLFHMASLPRQILLIFLACPTGIASYILADILGSDKELAAHIIVVSTLLSAISLSIVLAIGG